MRNLLKNQKGFTLVELLAVIVILAIISAIAVPSVGHLISKTQDNAKVAEAVQIISAAKLYVQAENPTFTGNSYTIGTSTTSENTALEPYINNLKDNTFTVTITKDGNNKYTYRLNGHDDPVSNGGSATEADLLGTTTP